MDTALRPLSFDGSFQQVLGFFHIRIRLVLHDRKKQKHTLAGISAEMDIFDHPQAIEYMTRPLLFLILLCLPLFSSAQTSQTLNNGAQTQPISFPSGGCTYSWTNDQPGIGLPASGSGDIAAFTAINTGSTPIIATITATPTSGNGYIFAANPYTNKVAFIDAATGVVETYVQVGGGPGGLGVSPDGSKLYVANAESSSISVVDIATRSVMATIPVGAYPYGVVVSPDGSTVYVTNQGANGIAVIDAATNTVSSNIALNKAGPWGISISPDGARLFATDYNSNSIFIINTATKAIQNVPVGNNPIGISTSSKANFVYVANFGSGTVSVVDVVNAKVLATIPVGDSPMGIAISADGTRAYVTNSSSGTVSVIDATTNKVIATVPVGSAPEGISVSPDGSHVYVMNTNGNSMSVINTTNNSVQTFGNINNGQYSIGSFVSGCLPITLTIAVDPTVATLTASPLTGTISSCAGSPSAPPFIAQLSISGKFLSSGVTASCNAGFEVSLNTASAYGNTVTIPAAGGTVPNTILYIRASATAPPGQISGNLSLTTDGLPEQDIALSGIVNPLPAIAPVASQTLMNGQQTQPVDFTGAATAFDWINDTPSIGLAAAGTGDIAAFTAVNTGTLPVTATITVTPEKPTAAYIGNAANNTVSVINLINNQVIKTISVGNSPYGVAVSPDGTRVYISNILGQSVSVIDALTNEVIATVKVGTNPFGISVSPDGNAVYVANEESNSVSVISAKTDKVLTTINTGQYPVFTLVSPDGSRLYVANQFEQTITVYNTSNYALLKTLTYTGFPPFQMALNADGSLLYFIALDNNHSFFVVDAKTYQTKATFQVGQNAHGLALTPNGSAIYVPNTGDNTISVISTAANAVIKTIAAGDNPTGVSISPDGKYAYVTNNSPQAKGTVSVISTESNSIIGTFNVGKDPIALGNFITPGSNCDGIPATFTITVNPSPKPIISTTAVTGTISACEGTASATPAIEQFDVSAINLTADLLVSASSGLEVSTDAAGSYTNTLTLHATGGTITSTTIFLRSSASAVPANLPGDVQLISNGATSQQVSITGTILSLATVDQVPDQSEENAVLSKPILFTGTATSYEWVNDNTAIGLDASGHGTIPPFYPVNTSGNPIAATITVTPANNDGCNGQPINFHIMVNPTPTSLVIPNTFTPNGDGINDTWDIKNITGYPHVTVSVYNRWGQTLFASTGYAAPWDGTYKGHKLASGTYYYLIDLHNGQAVHSGWVAIVQ